MEATLNWLLYDNGVAREAGMRGREAVLKEYNEQRIIKPIFKDLL
jgi:hypothetical protein